MSLLALTIHKSGGEYYFTPQAIEGGVDVLKGNAAVFLIGDGADDLLLADALGVIAARLRDGGAQGLYLEALTDDATKKVAKKGGKE